MLDLLLNVVGLTAVLTLTYGAGVMLAIACSYGFSGIASKRERFDWERELLKKLCLLDAAILLAAMIAAWRLDMPFTIAVISPIVVFVIVVAVLVKPAFLEPHLARKALSQAKDTDKEALKANLEEVMTKGRIQNDVIWISLPLLLLVLGVIALRGTPAHDGLAKTVATVCDVFLFYLLMATGVEKKLGETRPFLPYVTAAVLILLLSFAAIIVSFAAMYVSSVSLLVHSQSVNCTDGTPVLQVRDAIYFSMGAMTWHPTPDICLKQEGRWIFISEVSSGFLVLLLAIPVLTRRIGR